ncbi:MAG TPA: PDZ domain-containing protein [Fluviicola sp.]|nr:PDZ domain-containing protein [Fluviicola sp.]
MRLLFILAFCLPTLAFSQSIKYALKMPKPQNHYFEVEMELKGFKASELTVKMPVWAPGSYLVREFSRHVNYVKAVDENNKELKVTKTAKNEWKIAKGKAKSVKVNYDVYAFELSVRTSFLDLSHGFVSGSSVFFYVDGFQQLPGTLDVYPYSSFKTITTPLVKSSESVQGDAAAERFTFTNYDELVDSPIEIGNHELFYFQSGGTHHQVALYGLANYDMEQLKVDMEKITAAATNVFGQNPCKEYTFIIHNVINGQGGLEHANSCVLSVNRWTYAPGEYNNFLSLVAHEYFHLWNVKRIRPIELGPFDYDEENYTTLLWVMEGFTSYYDELLMVRAGYYSKEDYLRKLQGTINYVEGSPGSRVQSVAHASFDAWIKAYRPNENSGNTTMTYYSRGAMLASLLDAMIIDKFNATKCLDHFMRYLYDEFYVKKKRGFTEAEFQQALETFMGEDMDAFFNDHVYGTKIPDFKTVFSKVAVNVVYTGKPAASFGASVAQEGGKTIVKSIRSGSAAEEAGISVGDEIIACNGIRVDQTTFDNFISSLVAGEYIELIVAREEIVLNLQSKMTAYERPSFRFETMSPSNEKFYYWLRSLE